MVRVFLCGMLLVGCVTAQQGPQPIGEVQGADASVRGAVTVGATGTTLMSGSQVTAGANPATIKLVRGGELKVCPGSSITITASASGREALVGLNAGTIETRYRLSSNADTIMTPDFRLLLPGPGDFHFAVGMRNSGDMCVKSLPGNGSAMIVHEVFGEGTYQLRAGDAVIFRQGTVQDSLPLPAGEVCGCANIAAVKPRELGFPEQQSERAAAAIAAGEPPPQTSPPLPGVSADKNQVITKVDAPIIFRGEDLPAAKPAPPSEPAPVVTSSASPSLEPTPAQPKSEESAPPAAAESPKPVKKKWYQRFGSAFAKLFRR